MSIITSDESVLGGEPRIRGTRIAVRHVVELMRDGGLDIETTAEQLDLDNASVQHCIEYYDSRRSDVEAWDEREAGYVGNALGKSRAGDR
jgi:uncharacterized protein (DUF433 family)